MNELLTHAVIPVEPSQLLTYIYTTYLVCTCKIEILCRVVGVFGQLEFSSIW